MRIFLSSLLILAHLSLLGAALSTHSKDVGSQVDYEVAGGPSGRVLALHRDAKN